MPKILVLRPAYEPVTCRVSTWGGDIVRKLESLEINHIDCHGECVTRDSLIECIELDSLEAVAFYGHGDGDVWYGHDKEIILDEMNSNLLNGKFIYDVSCYSGRGLGKLAMDNDAKCYVGYKAAFKLSLKEFLNSSKKDFFKIGANFMLEEMLINKKTASEAYRLAQEKYSELILHLEKDYRKIPDDDDSLAIKYLFAIFCMNENKDSFIFYGDPEFRLFALKGGNA